MQSYLYVIAPDAHENGPCKLGLSSDPARRLKQIQTSHPERLALKHMEPVDADKVKVFERLLHRDIGYLRLRGEWFGISVDDAIVHVRFTVIQYDGIADLVEKAKSRKI